MKLTSTLGNRSEGVVRSGKSRSSNLAQQTCQCVAGPGNISLLPIYISARVSLES